jgi:hypothetical protein
MIEPRKFSLAIHDEFEKLINFSLNNMLNEIY